MKCRTILFRVIGTLCLLGMLVMGAASSVHAYTDEEVAQAKAWLSAHGYSPDSAGAAAAYQDYLDGKFDEEFGITTEARSTTESKVDHNGNPIYKPDKEKETPSKEEIEDGTSEESDETIAENDAEPEVSGDDILSIFDMGGLPEDEEADEENAEATSKEETQEITEEPTEELENLSEEALEPDEEANDEEDSQRDLWAVLQKILIIAGAGGLLALVVVVLIKLSA